MNHFLVEFALLQNDFPKLAGLLLGLLKSSAILTMAFAAAAFLRSARARSWIWRVAFLGLALLCLPASQKTENRNSGLTWVAVPASRAETVPAPKQSDAEVGTLQNMGGASSDARVSFLAKLDKWTLPVWWGVAGTLAVLHLFKVLAGVSWLRRKSRSAANFAPNPGGPEVRVSELVETPLLAGMIRPAIYLPVDAENWPEAKLQSVLRHETAHHARRDLWWQSACSVIGSLWWANPLAWLALRAVKIEAEEAADDAVISQEGSADRYARLLVEIASAPIRSLCPGISMRGCSALEKRLRAILAGNPRRGTIGAPGAVLLGFLAASIMVCLSFGIVLADFDLTNGHGEIRHYQAEPSESQFPQGNFRVTGGTLKDWTGALDQASSPQRGMVRLKPGSEPVAIETAIAVDPAWKWLTVRARTRPGGEGKFAPDQQGEVIFTPEGADGAKTGPAITLTDARRSGYTNWTSPMETFAVPAGTVKLKVSLRLTPGTTAFDCSEIFVIPSDPANELDHRLVDKFFDAVKANDAAAVESLLKSEPKLANSRRGSQDNGTPLTLCAWNELPEMAALLVKNGAKLEAEDTGAWRATPLTWCGWWGSPKTAKVLLDAGANPKFTSAFGVTPLSSAKAGKGANKFGKSTPEDFDTVIALFAEAQR